MVVSVTSSWTGLPPPLPASTANARCEERRRSDARMNAKETFRRRKRGARRLRRACAESPGHVGGHQLLVAGGVPLTDGDDATPLVDEDTERHRLLRIVEGGDARILVGHHREMELE